MWFVVKYAFTVEDIKEAGTRNSVRNKYSSMMNMTSRYLTELAHRPTCTHLLQLQTSC